MLNANTPGGAFKGPSTGMNYNHNHASMMAHSAATRLALAKNLGGAPAVAPVAPVGAVPSVPPVAPVGAVPSVPPMGTVGPQNNYKVAIAHHLAKQGHHVAVAHIHNAIDNLTQAGHFTPQQGAQLKAHNGPLGADGPRAMQNIAQAVIAGQPRPGMPGIM